MKTEKPKTILGKIIGYGNETQLEMFNPIESRIVVAEGAIKLPEFLLRSNINPILKEIESVLKRAPLRRMKMMGGGHMIPMSNCGDWGWTSDEKGYRYQKVDPDNNEAWPAIPAEWLVLVAAALAEAGFPVVTPTSCLINAYSTGDNLGLHQDRDEADHTQPIVSFSIGLPARFVLGGLKRNDPLQEIELRHGDVFVFGGAARMRFHGILPIKAGYHAATGACRYNLTFRVAK